MIELKNIRSKSDSSNKILTLNVPHHMPLLSDVIVILLCWTVVLTQNGQFLDCATIAVSERYYCKVQEESEPKILHWIKEMDMFMSWNSRSVQFVPLHYKTQQNKLLSDSELARQLIAECIATDLWMQIFS